MEKKNLDKTREQKEAMLRALEKNNGNIRNAALQAGISERTHYRWCKEDGSYDDEAGTIKDVWLRNAKEQLLACAMRKVESGDTTVLNKMLGIFYKDFTSEMLQSNRYNKVPLMAKLNYVRNREEARQIMGGMGELPQGED